MKRAAFTLLTWILGGALLAQVPPVLDRATFVRIVLENHPVARQAALRPALGEEAVRSARGGFDPVATANYDGKRFDEKNYYRLFEAGLKVPTWYGVELFTGFRENNGDRLDPQATTPADGLVELGGRISLGQGLLMDQRRASLRKAQAYLRATAAEQEQMLNDLLLQALHGMATAALGNDRPVLYVSGEESVQQTALRYARIGGSPRSESLLVLAETRLPRILEEATKLRPRVLAVDSIQTVHSPELESVPGSLGQVREAAGRLLAFAKERGVPTILVGHVTKDGALAGPKTLEHVVDAVIHFEGESSHPYRVLRATKNRFGSTNEVGVFEMGEAGLREGGNPSALFLAERPTGVPGSTVTAAVEGSRPLLVEVQALVSTASGMPRRAALGVDPNRVSLLLAVINRRAGIDVLDQDVFVNVVGGVRLGEPAADLAVIAAVASSAASRPVDAASICFGEVGLAGEVRAVSQPELRLAEAAQMGFKRAILPEANRVRLVNAPIEVIGVKSVEGALEALLDSRRR